MLNRPILSAIVFFSVTNYSYALNCPTKTGVPLCPNSGVSILDETYPTQAFVISDGPQMKTAQSSKVTSQYINTIIKSYDFENVPQIFVPVYYEEDFLEVVDKVKSQLVKAKIAPEKIEGILSQISHVQSTNYTWQQDYFESFVDLKTGTPVLREFESYLGGRPMTVGAVKKMEDKGRECSVVQGELLKSEYPKYDSSASDLLEVSIGSGEMGGNVDGAPGGLCLFGDNLSKKLAKNFCGSEDNFIQLQTSWLSVGHVDEVFKIIPSNFNDGRPKECQFSLMAASPKKALELLEAPKNKAAPFFSLSPNLNEVEIKEVRRSRTEGVMVYGNKMICDYIKSSIQNGSHVPPKNTIEQSRQNKTVLFDLLINQAMAGLSVVEAPDTFNCEDHIDQISNSNIKDSLIKDQDTINLNTAIQESIDKDKALIRQKILARLPQCEKYYDVLDVPDLFYGSPPIQKNGKFELPRPSDANSFLPNPTNSVLMNRTVLLPESGNDAFDSYIEGELKKRKLNTEKIDSWDYAHIGKGNIHCSSHSITHCQPRL